MNSMAIASEESAFRAGLKDAGFKSSDFMVKYDRAAGVRVSRISNAAAYTFQGGGGIAWAHLALQKVEAGLFGTR
jgi:hypothetical protein